MIQLGVDVGKNKIDVCLHPEGPQGKVKMKALANGPDVARRLLDWLTTRKVSQSEVQVIMEPTGTYHEHLAYGLHAKGIRVVIGNPARVRSFATGMGILTKNDSVDAHVLALYGTLRQPDAWQPPPLSIRELKALLSRRDALLQDLQREQNRLEKLHSTLFYMPVEASIRKMIEALSSEMLAVQKLIDDHIDNHLDLKQDLRYLTSIKGIGNQVGPNMLAMLRGNNFSSGEQAAAWLGLVPQEKRSGSSVNGRARLTKIGPAALRAKLFFSAMTAIKHNPPLKNYYERLLQNGKARMSALCAVMRKLVLICYAVLKKQQEFDPRL